MTKLIFIFFLLYSFVSNAQTSKLAEEGFFVHDRDKKLLTKLKKHSKFIIDHPSRDGYELYGPKGLKEWLGKNSPFPFESLKGKEKSLSGYPTPEEIEQKLINLQKKYPHIFKLFSIGKTKQNRELWVMKVSDNVHTDEVEPEFKYVANMHGDEIVGREMMVSLLEDIGRNYTAGDVEILKLVNNTEIFIMPSLNPDGAAGRRRGNGNWVDLNRDFPDFEISTKRGLPRSSKEVHEIETLAMMKFQSERNFALSANFHGGTEVVNYPWDSRRGHFPHQDLIIALSLDYARKIPSMRDNREFVDGVVNGYEWYEIHGGMQDWSYHSHQDLQVTIELSHSKWPRYEAVPSYYKKNKDSLFGYIKSIHQGFGVYSTNRKSFKIVISKKRETGIEFIESINVEKREFYKVLSPGKYRIEILTDKQNKQIEIEINKEMIQSNGNYIVI